MIAGTVIIEDVTINFTCDFVTGKTTGFVSEINEVGDVIYEQLNVPNDSFLKALAIAVHMDGTPDWQADYPAAEAIMEPDGIRWIP